ncbi:MAG: MBL fold metallo-hydrolase [Candidatus Eremiobacteraeota bacterium]|nr:MBL fold metallo-hydrolase [Candidatus Eremiobacteraeota bacterium]
MHKGLTVTYIGHATTLISMGGTAILTDPWLGKTLLFLERRRLPVWEQEMVRNADIAAISHEHPDHFDLRSLGLLSRKTTILVPELLVKDLRKLDFEDVRPVKEWDKLAIHGLEIEIVPVPHRSRKNLGYVFKSSGNVFFAGDMAPSSAYGEILKKLPGIDIALMPVGGFAFGPEFLRNHLAINELCEVLKGMKPRAVIPIHWGHNPIFPFMERLEGTGEMLRKRLREVCPEVATSLLNEGESYRF